MNSKSSPKINYKNTNPKRFVWHSLGGLGEVGMNCMVFQFGQNIVPVDAGILFADTNDFGIESIFPDYSELLLNLRPKVWIITHAHEDHIGAVPYLLKKCEELNIEPPMIHAPDFAAALIREKLTDSERISGGARFLDRIESFSAGDVIEVGDVKIHPVPIRHSTADAYSLAMEWKPAEGAELRVVHTADFKIDEKKFEDGQWSLDAFDVFGGRPLDLLFVDSTNAERDGHSVSEVDITSGLTHLVTESQGRVYATLFSSNVYRIANLLRIARETGRTACLAGRSLKAAYRIATEQGLFQRECPDFKGVSIVDTSEINRIPRDKQMIICSGSQGEFRSALMRLASSQHSELVLDPDDTVIFSSKTIPGNEKGVSRIINSLLRAGAKVYHGDWAKIHAGGPVHASGHARRGEISILMNYLKPQHVVPVHGELRQLLSCAEVAEIEGKNWGLRKDNIRVVENGMQLSYVPVSEGSGWKFDGKQLLDPQARILRFDGFLSPSRDEFLKTRKRAATGGVVSACLDATGRARVQISGVLPEHLPVDAMEIERWLSSQYAGLKRSGAFNGENPKLELEIADEMARFVRRIAGVKPFTVVHLVP